MSRVFLSYPTQSLQFVRLLVAYLKSCGAEATSIDIAEIRPGDYVAPKVQEAVREATCCVLVLNTYSEKSPWCMAEVGAFWGAGKPIIVYPVDPPCAVPPYLVGIRTANTLEELADACKEIPNVNRASPVDPLLGALLGGGLRHAFRIPSANQLREDRIRQLIGAERSISKKLEFRLLASSGYNYLHPNGKVWQGGLGRAIKDLEASLVAVLESPFSPFAVTRALANEVTYHHWYEKLPLDILLELDRRANVKILVTEHPVNCSLFFNGESVFYDPYLWGRPSAETRTENNFWVFEFEHLHNSPDDCFALLAKHFDFLVQRSSSLADFLGNLQGGYERRSQEFKETLSRMLGQEKA